MMDQQKTKYSTKISNEEENRHTNRWNKMIYQDANVILFNASENQLSQDAECQFWKCYISIS